MPGEKVPPAILVMGVSSSGKTTVGELLAQRLGWEFRDADSFHPPANIAKMSAGTPLTDEDRWPWLDAIAAWIERHRLAGTHGVASCSALKRAYRDRLRDGHEDLRIVHLAGDFETIAARMAARQHHFMPPSLLRSQFETLETPTPDERILVAPVTEKPGEIVTEILSGLSLSPGR